jgi:hypothetical protein
MTSLIATITPERGWLTQDTGITDERCMSEIARIEKITAIAERRMLCGGAGNLRWVAPWPAILKEFSARQPGHTGAEDIDVLNEYVPTLLHDLIRHIPVPEQYDQELIIAHVGWSRREGRVVGYFYERAQAFAPVRIVEGHVTTPGLDDRAPGFDHLMHLQEQAREGRNVAETHAAMFRNQRWALQQGALRHRAGLSESYTTVTVGESGCRRLGRFGAVWGGALQRAAVDS